MIENSMKQSLSSPFYRQVDRGMGMLRNVCRVPKLLIYEAGIPTLPFLNACFLEYHEDVCNFPKAGWINCLGIIRAHTFSPHPCFLDPDFGVNNLKIYTGCCAQSISLQVSFSAWRFSVNFLNTSRH